MKSYFKPGDRVIDRFDRCRIVMDLGESDLGEPLVQLEDSKFYRAHAFTQWSRLKHGARGGIGTKLPDLCKVGAPHGFN